MQERNGNAFLGSHDITTLESVRFGVGRSEHNHLDPSAYPGDHPLAPQLPSMHWGWASRYFHRFGMEGWAGEGFLKLQIHAWEISTIGLLKLLPRCDPDLSLLLQLKETMHKPFAIFLWLPV